MAAKPKVEPDGVPVTQSHGLVGCDFNDLEKTGKFFEEKFNDIIAKCMNEVKKISNLDLRASKPGPYCRFT